ncbi:MAG: N-acetylneuraminate synthase family protein [Deltaproteobacteria bacterium]|nr:N-acetylneuraminate synthase family protein [Deltaproteobacteria bacterium]
MEKDIREIFIIAEVGNTHEGSLELARCFIKAVADCGADAVKFQTHIFDAESLPDAPNPPYFRDESRKRYFERTAFEPEQYADLIRYTEQECGLEFISSAFSATAVELLEDVGVKRYKIPSGEVTNTPLLEKIARTGKPVLLSSGMSNWKELDRAVEVLKGNGCGDLTVLQCSSFYPCPPQKTGLNIIQELQNRYGIKTGFSDHTMGVWAAIAAVVLGANVIEKHFTLSQSMYGSDAKHSLEPDGFKRFVEAIREVSLAVGNSVDKDAIADELQDMKRIFEKSIVSGQDIPEGIQVNADMLCYKKPGDGLSPDRVGDVVGKTAKIDIAKNTQIRMEMLQ